MNGGMGSPTEMQTPRMASSASQNVRMDHSVDEDLVRNAQGLSIGEQDSVRDPETLPSDSYETAPIAPRPDRAAIDPRTHMIDSSAEGIITDTTPIRTSKPDRTRPRLDQVPTKIDAKPVYLKGLFR